MTPSNGSKVGIREFLTELKRIDEARVASEMAQDQKRQDMERRLVEAINSAVGGIAETLGGLKSSVDDHHKTLHLHNLTRNIKFWGYALVVFVVVNVAVDIGHPFVVALIKAWTGIQLP